MKMKDLDDVAIEDIIRLPFFHSLEKEFPKKDSLSTDKHWKITFRCNKVLPNGLYGLLDAESESEYIVRYKLIDFKH
jgi:hypothetical protein